MTFKVERRENEPKIHYSLLTWKTTPLINKYVASLHFTKSDRHFMDTT
jgi:hypothetical protein